MTTEGFMQGKEQRRLLFGRKVDRADAALPQSTHTPYFNVVGGRVIILGLIGQVGTVIQSQADAIKFIAEPTVGTSADLCATKDINALEAGALLSITGLQSDAMFGVGGAFSRMCKEFPVVAVGTIDLNTAASNTGTTKWSLFYVPLDDGAYVTAA